MSFGIGFFFGFDNTPTQLYDAIFGNMGGGSIVIPKPTPPVEPNNAASLAAEQATFREGLRRKTIQGTNTYAGGPYAPAAGGGVATPGGNGPMAK